MANILRFLENSSDTFILYLCWFKLLDFDFVAISNAALPNNTIWCDKRLLVATILTYEYSTNADCNSKSAEKSEIEMLNSIEEKKATKSIYPSEKCTLNKNRRQKQITCAAVVLLLLLHAMALFNVSMLLPVLSIASMHSFAILSCHCCCCASLFFVIIPPVKPQLILLCHQWSHKRWQQQCNDNCAYPLCIIHQHKNKCQSNKNCKQRATMIQKQTGRARECVVWMYG